MKRSKPSASTEYMYTPLVTSWPFRDSMFQAKVPSPCVPSKGSSTTMSPESQSEARLCRSAFHDPTNRAGLGIVPILLIANLLLGVYVNLSIWYKLTDRTLMGAVVSIGGALVTVVCLLWWVPRFGYIGAAWATLACYASMVLASYLLGRKYYPVPYDVKRVSGYIGLGIVIYLFNRELVTATGTPALLSGTVLLLVYLAIAYALDGRKARRGRLN